MIYPLDPTTPLPENVAKWLAEYIAKHGVPYPTTESLAIEIGQGSVEIKEFSMKEQE